MTDLLFDVNLQQLPDEFLAGEWRVADRVLNRTSPDSVLAQAERFYLRPDAVEVQAATQQDTGRWNVQRDALLNRPYLELSLMQEQTRALITRLRRSRSGEQSLLNLYFQSGMEIQLARP